MKEVLYIYCRVSTDLQRDKGSSLEEQERFGIELAKSLDMDYEVHNEGAKSGSDTDISTRPVFSNLMALVREGEVKHLFVEVLDRLTRDDQVSSMVNSDFAKNRVTVYTRTARYDPESLEDSFMMKLLGLFAQYDNQLRTQRLKTGRFLKAKQGFWVLGNSPFGYKLGKNKKLVIDKNQSPWVEKMFAWYDQGMSLPEIKKQLDGRVETNNKSAKTGEKSLIWSMESVRNLLTNTHHKGYYTYLGVKIPCPRIVEDDLWERVNKTLADKTTRQSAKRSLGTGKGNKTYDFALSPLMTCGDCGTSMQGQSQNRSGGERTHSYLCGSRDKKYKKGSHTADWKRGKYCKNTTSCSAERLEDVVWETLSEILKVSHQHKEEFKGLTLSTKKTSSQKRPQLISHTQTEIANLEQVLARIESSIDEQRILKIESPSDEKKIDKFIKRLSVTREETLLKIQEKMNQLVSLENDSLWVDWVKDYQDNIKNLDELSREEKNKEITKYVQSILVSFNEDSRTHNLKLRLKLPLVGDGLVYKDNNKKSDGYKITEGSYEKEAKI